MRKNESHALSAFIASAFLPFFFGAFFFGFCGETVGSIPSAHSGVVASATSPCA